MEAYIGTQSHIHNHDELIPTPYPLTNTIDNPFSNLDLELPTQENMTTILATQAQNNENQ